MRLQFSSFLMSMYAVLDHTLAASSSNEVLGAGMKRPKNPECWQFLVTSGWASQGWQ
jgi:hypothetical protein